MSVTTPLPPRDFCLCDRPPTGSILIVFIMHQPLLVLLLGGACCDALLTPPRLGKALTAQNLKLKQQQEQHLRGGNPPDVTLPIHLKIDGKWYDVSDWADKHPGGRYVLEWADGYDVTGAFKTIHLFGTQKAEAILGKMPEANLESRSEPAVVLPPIVSVPGHGAPTGMDTFMNVGEACVRLASPPATDAATRRSLPVAPAQGLAWQLPQPVESTAACAPAVSAVGTVGDSLLKRDLEKMLRRRFKSPEDYKATPEHWARIGGALALWAVCLGGWVQGHTGEALLLPFAQWLLFSPTVHEASHSTLSTSPIVNKAMAFCGLPFIYNPYIWWTQHILSHHQYTNDDKLDVDLHHLRPARLHPGCAVDESASGFNFIFKGYFSTLGMSALWSLRNLQNKSTGRWYKNLITPKPSSVPTAEFALSLAPVAFCLTWPPMLVLAHLLTGGEVGVNALHGFMLWLYPWATTGAIWTVMTQVSHVQESCQRPPTGESDDYFRWQIESALDYSVGSSLVPKLTATLNLQSMHHVMPSVCGCHFAGMYDEYAAICAKHGVRLNTAKDLSAAWRGCIERVFQLSSPELTPAWAADDGNSDADADDAAFACAASSSSVASVARRAEWTEHLPLAAYLLTPAAAFGLSSPFW